MLLKSKNLKATFNTLGAELKSLSYFEKELLWQGKENFWSQTAPILFPFCGFLKNGFYIHEGKRYEAPVHGFAAISEFFIENITDSKVTFILTGDHTTKKMFPFDFRLSITYELNNDELHIEFKVKNTSKDTALPFSIGWHPGFISTEGTYIKLPNSELKKRTVSKEGLIGTAENIHLENGILELNQKTFKEGGIVIENHQSEIDLHTSNYQIGFKFEDFPNLVIWGQPGADFVCVEPWFGMGDSIDHNNIFIDKENLITLKPEQEKSHQLSLNLKVSKKL